MLAFYLLSRDKTHQLDKFWSSEYKEMLAFYLLGCCKIGPMVQIYLVFSEPMEQREPLYLHEWPSRDRGKRS